MLSRKYRYLPFSFVVFIYLWIKWDRPTEEICPSNNYGQDLNELISVYLCCHKCMSYTVNILEIAQYYNTINIQLTYLGEEDSVYKFVSPAFKASISIKKFVLLSSIWIKLGLMTRLSLCCNTKLKLRFPIFVQSLK